MSAADQASRARSPPLPQLPRRLRRLRRCAPRSRRWQQWRAPTLPALAMAPPTAAARRRMFGPGTSVAGTSAAAAWFAAALPAPPTAVEHAYRAQALRPPPERSGATGPPIAGSLAAQCQLRAPPAAVWLCKAPPELGLSTSPDCCGASAAIRVRLRLAGLP
jgi:hypothetical protein